MTQAAQLQKEGVVVRLSESSYCCYSNRVHCTSASSRPQKGNLAVTRDQEPSYWIYDIDANSMEKPEYSFKQGKQHPIKILFQPSKNLVFLLENNFSLDLKKRCCEIILI